MSAICQYGDSVSEIENENKKTGAPEDAPVNQTLYTI